MTNSTWRSISNAQNSSKSGARSNELPPEELYGGEALLGGPLSPVREVTILPGALGECRYRHRAPVEAEVHERIVRVLGVVVSPVR